MSKRTKRVILSFILLSAALALSACSAEDLLSEVPFTVQLEPEIISEWTQTGSAETETGDMALSSEPESQCFFQAENSSAYAYDRLSAEEQLWYRDIELALGNMQEKVKLSEEGLEAGLDENCIDTVFQCVLMDHPEFFYVEGYNYTKYTRGDNTVSLSFSGKYELTPKEAAARKEEIEQAAGVVLAGIDAQASEYDKVKYVYETIIKNTDYKLNAPDNQNIYSVFVGRQSVCQGYAKAAQYLLNRLGVECTLVQGIVETGEGHAWNLVKVDGSYYYVDVTWGDASYLNADGQDYSAGYTPEINYDYLCITTEQLLRTHTPEEIVQLPECTGTAANYYVREDALFYSYDREKMSRLFQTAQESGRADVTVKCADSSCFAQMQEALIENQEIFDYLPDSGGTITYACNDKQLSLTFWMTNQ